MAIAPSRLLRTATVVTSVLVLGACSSGSTEVTTEPTGVTETEPTGPTASGPTGTTGATGPTAEASIAGTWQGGWTSDAGGSGTFTMTFEETADGFAGTIQIQGSTCVSEGEVTADVDGNSISIGAVRAEQQIEFEGEIVADTMAGTYASPSGCGNDTGTWEAALSG